MVWVKRGIREKEQGEEEDDDDEEEEEEQEEQDGKEGETNLVSRRCIQC